MSIDNEISNDIRLDGDRELRASVGIVGITITDEQVWLSIPDRFGNSTAYNFSHTDWTRIVAMISRAVEQPTDDELDVYEGLRARPENLQLGVQTIDAFVAYYRLNPPQEEFDGTADVGVPGDFPVSVGVCGVYGRVLNEYEDKGLTLQPEDQPDHQDDVVVLGIHGAAGRRLTNVLLGQDEAIQLARMLLGAAETVSPPEWDAQKQIAIGRLVDGLRKLSTT